MKMNIYKNKTILTASDAGWINGHTYSLYGPLSIGATTILIEKPIFSKSELIDLVIRADVLTLHMISGPIHIIDAITGFEIADKIREKAEIGSEKIKDAVELIQRSSKKLPNPKTRRLEKSIRIIRRVFNLS